MTAHHRTAPIRVLTLGYQSEQFSPIPKQADQIGDYIRGIIAASKLESIEASLEAQAVKGERE